MKEETYSEVIYTTIKDEESNSLNISASLALTNIENDKTKSIGYANLYIFNEYKADSWEELVYNADTISGDVLEVIDILNRAKNNEKINGLIAVLDHIEIYKKYRGNGYCSELVDKILEDLEYIDVNYIGLIPARIYDDKVIPNASNAIKFYIGKGFKPISRRIAGNVVMGKSLVQRSKVELEI